MSRTDEEIRNEIFKRKRELEKKTSKRKKAAVFSVAFLLCCVASISAMLNRQTSQPQPQPSVNQTTQQSTGNNLIPLSLFEATAKNPETDSFSEDELHHIDVVFGGDLTYRQLLLDEYSKYGFGEALTQGDFGEYLGKIVETSKNEPSVKIGSQEPTLRDSKVYYHSAKGKTALIVQNDRHCSIFVLTGVGESLKKTYSAYGIESENDIAYMTYCVYGIVNNDYSEIENAKVTDRNKIKSFFEITKSLKAYEAPDAVSATPDWLNEAWEEYKKAPEKYKREDITINIHLNNGMILEGISYQPFLATGYIDGMELLSPEQNVQLRNTLTAD